MQQRQHLREVADTLKVGGFLEIEFSDDAKSKSVRFQDVRLGLQIEARRSLRRC